MKWTLQIKLELITGRAGVLGLSCALRLKQANYTVYIVASHFPGELDINYASPWAGSHFRAVPVTNEIEAFERKLTDETTEFFKQVSTSDPSSSIEFVEALEFFDDPSPNYTNLKPEQQYCTLNGFRTLEQSELPPEAKWGARYDAWVLNSPIYLLWLRNQLGEDVQFFRGEAKQVADAVHLVQSSLKDTDLSFRAIVNATGTGLNDPESSISRGQFLHISNLYDKTISHHHADRSSTVVVPRPRGGGTLIGGSKEPGNYSTEPNEDITNWIVDKVSKLCPDLGEPKGKGGLQVTQVIIGRRPMRKGGIRIGRESIELSSQRADGSAKTSNPPFVVHCYGAGGNGFKISWGAAGHVLRLIADP
jgi:D-amino-acid oxidase